MYDVIGGLNHGAIVLIIYYKFCVCFTIICVKTLAVYGMELNQYQWGQTRSALSWMIELVKNRKNKFEDVRKLSLIHI